MTARAAEPPQPLTFVDTNLLLYADDGSAGVKQEAAKDSLASDGTHP